MNNPKKELVTPERNIRSKKHRRLGSVFSTILAGFISLFVIFPFYWVISTALKSRNELARNVLGFPQSPQFENFSNAWTKGRFENYFMNSILQVIPTVAAIIFLSLLASYAFAIMRFKGKEIIFTIFIFGMAIPVGVLIIPLFYQMLDWNLYNTLWAIISPQIAIGLPFAILLLRTFIQELPNEILDAGCIDGCNHLQLLLYIVMPLSKPALLSLLIFYFMWNWNEFLLPVILIQTDANRTLPIGLNSFLGQYVTDIPLLMAGATISFLPIVIIYILFQRQFIKGIVAGALK